MKITKLISVLACLFLLSSMLVGCSSSSSGKSDSSSGKTVTLKIWGDADNQATLESSFTKINNAFMKKYPNIKLDYQYSGTLESINVALQSNSLPDLFWVQGNKSTKMAEMARNGYLLPLNKYNFDYSRFPKESVEYATVDGKVYSSLPSFIAYVTMFYNKDIFKKYNLKVPKTWDEFTNVVKELDKNGVTPLAVGGNGDFDRYWMLQAMAASLSTNVLTDIVNKKQNIDYTNLEKTFDYYREFAQKGYFGKHVAATDGTGARLSFTNGKTAMMPDGTWDSQIYKDVTFNLGTFALPGFDGKTYAQTGPYNGNTYAISSKTKHPDAAVKYLKFLNSKEAEQIMANETGLVPMLSDIKPKDDSVKEMANYDKVGLNIYNSLSQVADEKSKPQDLLLTDLLPKLMQNKIDGKQAVDLLKAELAKSTTK